MASLLLFDILDLSKIAWTCCGCFYTSSGLGLIMRLVKDLDPYLVLERTKTGSLPVHVIMHGWDVGSMNFGQSQS